ncbi:MAG: ABC transporter ATP-binding protein [Candidatus Omnitrophica bacterium]|nr:ABC transporter ATP-binding protein [Candidatus Omnitrophota bacterium]MDD5501387.1 ABC transporter ATP-binding protein [Candidatus Omnitrophota bacterium]
MIEIIGLHKKFNNATVLDGLSLNIEKGQTCVIIGRSGCGKSVLLKHIVGLLKPDSGKVLVDRKEVGVLDEAELDSLRSKISMVFQGGALFDSMNVAENVGFSLIEYTRLGYKEIMNRVEESLSLVGLGGIGNLMPAELSGGMKKRVALARAICIRPEVILYDEPTTGIDPIAADSINSLIRSLHDKLKVTSIVVTHDMKSAYHIADKIAMMYKGRIVIEGSPREIRESHNPVVHQFINGLAKGPITEAVDTFK